MVFSTGTLRGSFNLQNASTAYPLLVTDCSFTAMVMS